jgi:hypothetical protein
MSLFEDTNPRELKELLGQIHSRETALPDFQRDFVWDPAETQELIVSIASNYPAGSLLRIRNTNNLFASREFQGAPQLGGHKPTYLVLDGQQRLTSLYQAFFGVGESLYYVDLRELLDGAEFEEAIFHLRAKHKRAKGLEDFTIQARDLVLPLSVLKGGSGGFSRWSLKVARQSSSKEKHIELEDELSSLEEKWIRAIDDYRFPVVTLSDKTSADAVCTIFETLNRTGVKLSPFELLTARFWPKDVNLRRLWEKAQNDFPVIQDFEIDPYYVLQIVSLAARSAPSCKRSDVLDLDSSVIEKWWQVAVEALSAALKLLREDCGVAVPKWLPYSTIIIPLTAVLAKIGLRKGPRAAADRHKLSQWFWCAVFGQVYENAPNSQAAKDVVEIVKWLNDGPQPESVKGFRFDPGNLQDVTPRQRALYRGVICLILRGAPRDFHYASKLTVETMLEQMVDDHHIFPYDYLKKKGVPERLRDCVLNRTLIDAKTNRRIGARAPSDYLGEIRQSLKPVKDGSFQKLLESHLLPGGKGSPFWKDDFEGFLEWRKDAFWKEIKDLTGTEEASDLHTED